MAQEVHLMGATYSDVPSVLLPDSNGNYHSFVDATTASSWSKVAETTFTVSTTDTSAATVETWATGETSLWTSNAFVYVKIRDTAGKRAGYFYGTDNFFVNNTPINGDSSSSTSYRAGHNYRYTSDGKYEVVTNGTNGYGIYADAIYSDGRIRIRSRYNSSYSLTINGTYKVEVYLLTPPSAIFE